MAGDNLFEAFEKQEAITARLERIVFGDPPAQPVGLLVRMEQLSSQLDAVSNDLHAVKSRRPNRLLWTAGYVAFLVSGLFAMMAFDDTPVVKAALEMPPQVAAGLAFFFAALALLLLMGGFGWLDHGR